ncbi:PTS sugar transporter subunit IIC [Periweissella cryptocerci]|uniref:PTS sugar transporter subunit IIC n=1 Tax=Periweissella cryptocerci TaxID=2506420 RepID=A0A4P6YUG2_9LACO|nr:PTS sugar transporter subunit IIC [Periweissella cryptocerci]QBO36327.1 PTS sugar transporter subunit IIC [Periweissella cryptocerci]
METTTTKLTAKQFTNNVLNGSAQGILIGIIPNAVMAALLKFFITPGTVNWASNLNSILVLFQSFVPILIGLAIALQFKMKPLDIGVVAIATAAGSGATKFYLNGVNPATGVKGAFITAGTGDVINSILVAAIAVGVTILIGRSFGSAAIILSPIVVGGGVGLLGMYMLPYVSLITKFIGNMINEFTTLQPLLMVILIAISFAIILETPISTVGLALAIGLGGTDTSAPMAVAAAAAAIGVAATTIVLLINSWKTNKVGVTVAIALGAMKAMMPVVFRKPVIFLPIITTAIISAIPVWAFSVKGTPQSAGFGYIGLVGPIASADAGLNMALVLLTWLVVPVAAGLASHFVFSKLLKLYSPKDYEYTI